MISILGKIFSILCIFSFLFAILNNKMEVVSNSIIDSAGNAVTLTISLLGIMCLWCGIMQVAKSAGLIQKLSKLIAPLLKILFPTAYRTKNGIDEISANISANFLGIGNAATPLALKAMQAMNIDNPKKDTATDDMITFTVLNTASFDILPTTLIALRRASESQNPFSIIVPIWICSFSCTCIAILFSKLLRYFKKE